MGKEQIEEDTGLYISQECSRRQKLVEQSIEPHPGIRDDPAPDEQGEDETGQDEKWTAGDGSGCMIVPTIDVTSFGAREASASRHSIIDIHSHVVLMQEHSIDEGGRGAVLDFQWPRTSTLGWRVPAGVHEVKQKIVKRRGSLLVDVCCWGVPQHHEMISNDLRDALIGM